MAIYGHVEVVFFRYNNRLVNVMLKLLNLIFLTFSIFFELRTTIGMKTKVCYVFLLFLKGAYYRGFINFIHIHFFLFQNTDSRLFLRRI